MSLSTCTKAFCSAKRPLDTTGTPTTRRAALAAALAVALAAAPGNMPLLAQGFACPAGIDGSLEVTLTLVENTTERITEVQVDAVEGVTGSWTAPDPFTAPLLSQPSDAQTLAFDALGVPAGAAGLMSSFADLPDVGMTSDITNISFTSSPGTVITVDPGIDLADASQRLVEAAEPELTPGVPRLFPGDYFEAQGLCVLTGQLQVSGERITATVDAHLMVITQLPVAPFLPLPGLLLLALLLLWGGARFAGRQSRTATALIAALALAGTLSAAARAATARAAGGASLRELADERGSQIGSLALLFYTDSTNGNYVSPLRNDPQYRDTLASEFNLLVVANELMMEVTQPTPKGFDFSAADLTGIGSRAHLRRELRAEARVQGVAQSPQEGAQEPNRRLRRSVKKIAEAHGNRTRPLGGNPRGANGPEDRAKRLWSSYFR